MAIMQGITGKLSGKMGSAVFRVREGQQVVAQYNPIVKNPNTAGQQSTRATFKLMSQLAAIMSPGFGTMVAQNPKRKSRPSKRNAFFHLNYGLVTTADTAQGVIASIPMEQLKLTSSFRVFGNLDATTSSGSISMLVDNLSEEVKSARVILVSYPEVGGVKQATIWEIADVPVHDGEISYNFSGLDEGKYTILTYGLIPTESAAGKISLDSIHTPADADFVSAVELDQLVADGSIIETMTLGTNVTVSE